MSGVKKNVGKGPAVKSMWSGVMRERLRRLCVICRRIESVVQGSEGLKFLDILPESSWRHKGDIFVNTVFILLFVKRYFTLNRL